MYISVTPDLLQKPAKEDKMPSEKAQALFSVHPCSPKHLQVPVNLLTSKLACREDTGNRVLSTLDINN